jgi:hypothetical protein
MLKFRLALCAAIVAFGAYNYNHYQTVCGDTRHYDSCVSAINAGASDIAAHNAGNGIYR